MTDFPMANNESVIYCFMRNMFQGNERCYVFSIRLCEMAKASISHAGCILAYFKKPFKFLFIDYHSIGVSP